MTQKIVDAVSISAGGTHDVSFGKRTNDDIVLRVNGDSNSTDLSTELNGVKVNSADEGTFASPATSESVSNYDATSDEAMRFVETDGYEEVQFRITNNAASATTIDVYAEGY